MPDNTKTYRQGGWSLNHPTSNTEIVIAFNAVELYEQWKPYLEKFDAMLDADRPLPPPKDTSRFAISKVLDWLKSGTIKRFKED